jgi:muconolactone delta-isomerase
MSFDFLHNFCLEHFSFQGQLSEIWPKMHIGHHVEYSLFLLDFNETLIFATYFRKYFTDKIS